MLFPRLTTFLRLGNQHWGKGGGDKEERGSFWPYPVLFPLALRPSPAPACLGLNKSQSVVLLNIKQSKWSLHQLAWQILGLSQHLLIPTSNNAWLGGWGIKLLTCCTGPGGNDVCCSTPYLGPSTGGFDQLVSGRFLERAEGSREVMAGHTPHLHSTAEKSSI